MKRATVISAATFMLAALGSCLTIATPAAAYGTGDRISDRIGSREELRELLGDRIRGREDLRDLLADRSRGREDLRDLLSDRMERRARQRDLLADRFEGRNDLRELLADRMQSREDLRDLLKDRLERRALLRELLAEHVRAQEGRLSGLGSERLENAADERSGTGTGVNREDLRDLILDRIRNRGDVDQLLEQIRDRIEGQE